MKILGIILARGGSKRIPNKNRKLLGGKPLFYWSIDSVKNIQTICDVVLSTDDREIIKLSQDQEVKVPGIRPPELSSDQSSSVDACIHILDWYERNISEVDGVLLLQPTSPFRSKKTVMDGIIKFEKDIDATVIAVSKITNQTKNYFKIKDDSLIDISNNKINDTVQDIYRVNGSLYIISPKKLREEKSFFSGKLKPIIINSEFESIDIDTVLDFEIAEYIFSKGLTLNNENL